MATRIALDSRIQAETEALVGENRYADARKVSEVRSRFLQGSDEEVSVWALERDPEEARLEGGASVAPAKPKARAKRRRQSKQRNERWGRWRELAMGLALVTSIGAAAGLQLWLGSGSNVELYSSDRLTHLSAYLESGYRDGHGQGPTFIGRLTDAWGALPRERREELGADLVRNLEMQGISRVMLFDGR
jgi:hypothetical protein